MNWDDLGRKNSVPRGKLIKWFQGVQFLPKIKKKKKKKLVKTTDEKDKKSKGTKIIEKV